LFNKHERPCQGYIFCIKFWGSTNVIFSCAKHYKESVNTMNLHDCNFTKLFIFVVILLSMLNSIRFWGNPYSVTGQTLSNNALQNFKDKLHGGQRIDNIDYVKKILLRCRYHIIQEEEILQMLREWENLILSNAETSEVDKLKQVNQFFNKLDFANDIDSWGVEDYWTTPIEFIVCQTGDCEDFSIAKYFTLCAMGVPEDKLSFTYVKALKYNAFHMVLTYDSIPGAEPLILDNIVNTINSASERSDLIPIYRFNGTNLWLAKQQGCGKLIGSSNRLNRWQNLLERMSEKII